MKKMWVVSAGSYSDYRVLAVCDCKKTAVKLVDRYNAGGSYGYARVESLSYVDDPNISRVEVLSMSTTLWDDGSEDVQDNQFRVEWPFEPLYTHEDCVWRWVRAPIHGGKGGRLDVYGTDHERVRKVFGERRALLIMDDAFRAKNEIHG